MQLECANNKPVIDCKEFSTPEDSVVVEDLPANTYEDGIDLFCYPSSVAIPISVVELGSLLPRKRNSQQFKYAKLIK